MSVSKRWYLRERPPKGLCLAYVKLNIQAADSKYGSLKVSIAGIEGKLKDVDRNGRFLLESLRVTEEKQGLKVSFWCKSGTKCFKPTENPFKNCVEVTIFKFTKVVLESAEGKVATTDIHYMTDLSPCPVCTKRLPIQHRTMDSDFPDITFSYNGQYIIDYHQTYQRFKKQLQDKDEWIKLREHDSGFEIGIESIAGTGVTV